MSDLRMHYQDTDYIELPWYSDEDPSALPVKLAIKPYGTLAIPADAVTAQWIPGQVWTGGVRWLRLEVGVASAFGALAVDIHCMYVGVDGTFKHVPNHLVIFDTA